MKIAILTIGTRGDMQPYVALAKGLQSEGHDVTLGGPDNFAAWVESHGIRFQPLGIDMEAFLQKPDVRAALSGKWLRLAKLWREEAVPMLENLFQSTWEAARQADVIVYHPKISTATDIAEATGAIPICASPIPSDSFSFMQLFRIGSHNCALCSIYEPASTNRRRLTKGSCCCGASEWMLC